ncbi:hypothetical protein [Maritalea mediterranea]|uniref:Uncharacterized protein n=1 Tax=Maritalea mediterranea TaxID=2909667 RepID=A0ABS9EC12_9HYPH|nr:hypothetical protein [Maritalea mediterranea]MCF4099001.1 hypothetical protein [Maritalea mediterranea]
MRRFLTSLGMCFALASSVVMAEELVPSPLSAALAEGGLAGGLDYAETALDGDEQRFALGALTALQAVEHIFQVRYDNYSGRLPLVPGGRSQLRLNPDAQFDPAFVEMALKGANERWARAQNHLEQMGDEEFGLMINLQHIWFDVDSDGKQSPDEGLLWMMAGGMNVPAARGEALPFVQFDRADGRWLLAYTHVLQGMAEMVLSVDPTPAITKVTDGVARMRELGKVDRDPIFGDDNIIDTIAIVINALQGPPDQARTQKALVHFQAMIAANKEFWRLVALEEDDQAEWLPNPNQQSAFGVPVTEEMAAGWQDVLGELGAVLAGEALVPFWRLDRGGAEGVGVNVNKFLTAPSDLDLFLMVHGAAFAPYMEKGRVVDLDVLERFSDMTGGQGGIFALWFN